MAKLAIRKFQDLIGRVDLLQVRKNHSPKASTLDFKMLLTNALDLRPNTNIIGGSVIQNFELEKRSDNDLIKQSQDVIDGKTNEITIETTIHNEKRAFCSTLSYEIAR